ncbi:MAG: hypothetical protein ACOY5Y_05620 [Pseudomonadota bacterium]
MAGDAGPGREDAACPERAPGKWVRRRGVVKYSEALAERLCARVAAGEMFYVVCREPGMPTPQSVGRWARERPDFGARFRAARRAGGRPEDAGGGVWSYCPEAADEIFERLCEGESLTGVARDPEMPSLSTIFNWRRKFPEFEETVQLAMRIRAERFCDLGWELAMEASPETAYLTHVRLTQLRWTAGTMAPRVFRARPAEPERPPQVQTLLFRHFGVEIDPQTGEKVVVPWCPNPFTGRVEREDAPGWRPPPGCGTVPG